MEKRMIFVCVLALICLSGCKEAKPGDVWVEPVTGMEFVYVPSGFFMMGTPHNEEGRKRNEGPRHCVNVKGFWIGRYEVTNADYNKFDSEHDSGEYHGHSFGADRQPVVRVTWGEAKRFAEWLSKQSGYSFALPTEEQWEYAARGGKDNAYWWGGEPAEGMENCRACESQFAGKVTTPVGMFRANGYGLYDVSGNVAEWCDAVYNSMGYYSDANIRLNDNHKIVRGASWFSPLTTARVGERSYFFMDESSVSVGFRLIRN